MVWFFILTIYVLPLLIGGKYLYSRLEEPKCESYIELRLYNALVKEGYRVKTQVRCGPYYVDLCIGNIAIECDGFAYHSSPDQKKYDSRRSAYLYRNGYRSVLRFSGSDINNNLYGCVSKIEGALGKR